MELAIDHGTSDLRLGLCTSDTPVIHDDIFDGPATFTSAESVVALERHRGLDAGLSFEGACLSVVMPVEYPTLRWPAELTQRYFEGVKASKVMMAPTPLLATFASGHASGYVVDIGYTGTRLTPVVEGSVLHYLTITSLLGGYIQDQVLLEAGVPQGFVGLTKKANAYARPTALTEPDTARKIVTLPDQVEIDIGPQASQLGEILFQDCPRGSYLSLPRLLMSGLWSLPPDVRKAVKDNIVVCGGCAAARGFTERLRNELPGLKFHFDLRPDLVAWEGAAILGQLKTFSEQSVSRAEYNEKGPDVIYRRCLMKY